jgi:putative hydrolase
LDGGWPITRSPGPAGRIGANPVGYLGVGRANASAIWGMLSDDAIVSAGSTDLDLAVGGRQAGHCGEENMVFDFHTHTFWSDGELSVIEQVRRAVVNGYRAIGLTDHAGVGGLHERMMAFQADRAVVERYWPITVVLGVELTHLPPEAIASAAAAARDAGAEIVVLHGETPVEPVPAGTNHAGIVSGLVDIIGHPGLITEPDVREATERGVYLEISSRRGHSLANGHVARLAQRVGARVVVDSDAHAPSDLLTSEFQLSVARCAGIDEEILPQVTQTWPEELLARALARRGTGTHDQ